MKKLLAITAGLALIAGAAQASLIFNETFGTVSANTSLANHTTNEGFDNNDLTFSASIGSPDIRSTSNSGGAYTGASGGANVWLPSAGAAISIGGIDTSAFSGPEWTFDLSFGMRKEANSATDQPFNVAYSVNGTDWTSILTAETMTGGAGWNFYQLTDLVLPASETLEIRWENPGTVNSGMRVDDVTLSAIPEPTTMGLMALSAVGLLALRRRLA